MILAAEPNSPQTGEAIYKAQCVRCHGPAGEGTPDNPKALAGDRSVPQLSKLIAKTMPEDDPGTCTGDNADKVAQYIHEAFYSAIARERNRPPRIEPARLTVAQYRNALADLFASFGRKDPWDQERGLRGEYYKGRRYQARNLVIERRDPEVNFDFGLSTPDPEKIEPHELSVRWRGSVLAPRSGEYEIIVRTEHAFLLFVNDARKPLIDNMVKSGDETEFRAAIRLIGGRHYPIRLQFTKVKQGVNDKKKPKPTKASVALLWKPPGGAVEVIPNRALSPHEPAATFVSETPFPPDDRSLGYERATSISKAWEQATTDGAIEAAAYVADHLRELGGGDPEARDRDKSFRELCLKIAERAFRRPLSAAQRRLYVDQRFTEAVDPLAALKRSVLLILKSPRFLYREVGGESADAWNVASRLSFGIWDSIPDATLLEAAASDELATREQVSAQAERMMADPRAHAKLLAFFMHWLRLDQAPEISKDPKTFPGFDPSVVADLRTSLELTIEDAVWGDSPDFRRLLTTDSLYLNGRLAPFYGADLPADAPFRKVTFPRHKRGGLLTHPYLMATFSYTEETSPIHRGVFLSRGLLGRTLRPPPVAISPLAPDLHAGLTTRERVALQTGGKSCQTCHAVINPLGFALERFDAIGRLRVAENARPIDASGSYQTRSGDHAHFDGAYELASFLSRSEEAQSAFVEQMFHHLIKQPVRAYSPHAAADLEAIFAASRFDMRRLIVEVLARGSLELPTEDRSGQNTWGGNPGTPPRPITQERGNST
jgi:hypothetical protein